MSTPSSRLFSASEAGHWEWRGNVLFDANNQAIANVNTDVLIVGQHRLLIEHTPGTLRFRARATSNFGEVFTIYQPGLTLNSLEAQCGDRHYRLPRTSLWRKERAIYTADGGLMAVVRPLISGRVEIVDQPGVTATAPFIDAVFLSWGCVLADSPLTHPRQARPAEF